MNPNKSLWWNWLAGHIGNFGGFQTMQFKAFTEADNGNRKRLIKAFPEWFHEDDNGVI